MNIILVITDSHGKNLVFVTDTLKPYATSDAAKLIAKGNLTGIYVVRPSTGLYLRSYPNTAKKDNLDTLAISSYKLFSIPSDLNLASKLPVFIPYWKLYQDDLESHKKDGERIIFIDGQSQTTVKYLTEKLAPYRQLIFDAARHFSIDPYLLGAIILDELSRAAIIEEISDILLLYFIGVNTSVGIAQIKIDTAKGLIKEGYYNPNLNDRKLSQENIGKATRLYLYSYVIQPKHNIFFAAAKMKETIDRWMPIVDISNKPDIIGTLYSLERNPHPNPKPNGRGLQIAGEFYLLAKNILK